MSNRDLNEYCGTGDLLNYNESFHSSVRALIRNAFEMLNEDGTEPKVTTLNRYRGCFTPEFYPRRFALKDCIYQQRLDILSYLLAYNLDR